MLFCSGNGTWEQLAETTPTAKPSRCTITAAKKSTMFLGLIAYWSADNAENPHHDLVNGHDMSSAATADGRYGPT
jgi:hypothetical protein